MLFWSSDQIMMFLLLFSSDMNESDQTSLKFSISQSQQLLFQGDAWDVHLGPELRKYVLNNIKLAKENKAEALKKAEAAAAALRASPDLRQANKSVKSGTTGKSKVFYEHTHYDVNNPADLIRMVRNFNSHYNGAKISSRFPSLITVMFVEATKRHNGRRLKHTCMFGSKLIGAELKHNSKYEMTAPSTLP